MLSVPAYPNPLPVPMQGAMKLNPLTGENEPYIELELINAEGLCLCSVTGVQSDAYAEMRHYYGQYVGNEPGPLKVYQVTRNEVTL
jgi:hypothetical protein